MFKKPSTPLPTGLLRAYPTSLQAYPYPTCHVFKRVFRTFVRVYGVTLFCGL